MLNHVSLYENHVLWIVKLIFIHKGDFFFCLCESQWFSLVSPVVKICGCGLNFVGV